MAAVFKREQIDKPLTGLEKIRDVNRMATLGAWPRR